MAVLCWVIFPTFYTFQINTFSESNYGIFFFKGLNIINMVLLGM